LGKNLPARVPGQGRLATSRLRVPNLYGVVPAATGNLLSIGAPRHRLDPEIARSQHTNRQKQRGTNLKKKNYHSEWPVTVDSHLQKRNNKDYKKTYVSLCPLSVDWQSPDCESQILMVWS